MYKSIHTQPQNMAVNENIQHFNIFVKREVEKKEFPKKQKLFIPHFIQRIHRKDVNKFLNARIIIFNSSLPDKSVNKLDLIRKCWGLQYKKKIKIRGSFKMFVRKRKV